MAPIYKKIDSEFSGDLSVLRVIFSTKNPIHTLHLLNTEIPLATMMDYIEYLDVYESIKEQQEKEYRDKMEKENKKK